MSAASAMKMSYAGITKGTQALGAAMLLAATRGGTADALFAELQGSQPQMLAWLKRNLALMPPKAYRWVAEMHEIADFVGEDPAAHELYLGAAHFYEQIAQRFRRRQDAGRRARSVHEQGRAEAQSCKRTRAAGASTRIVNNNELTMLICNSANCTRGRRRIH